MPVYTPVDLTNSRTSPSMTNATTTERLRRRGGRAGLQRALPLARVRLPGPHPLPRRQPRPPRTCVLVHVFNIYFMCVCKDVCIDSRPEHNLRYPHMHTHIQTRQHSRRPRPRDPQRRVHPRGGRGHALEAQGLAHRHLRSTWIICVSVLYLLFYLFGFLALPRVWVYDVRPTDPHPPTHRPTTNPNHTFGATH